MVLMNKFVTCSRHAGNNWSDFQPFTRVMVQTGPFDLNFGFIIESADRVRNKNRFLIMLDDGRIKYFQKGNVSFLRYVDEGTFHESLDELKSVASSSSNSKQLLRVQQYYRYLIKLKKRNNSQIPVIARTRIEDNLFNMYIGDSQVIGLIEELDCSMVKLRVVEKDITCWLYTGDSIFVQNADFGSNNFNLKFAPMGQRFFKKCTESEEPYHVQHVSEDKVPINRHKRRKTDEHTNIQLKSKRSERHKIMTLKATTSSRDPEKNIQLPDLEEIGVPIWSDTSSGTSSDSELDLLLPFPFLDKPLSPNEFKRRRHEDKLKRISLILPPPEFQD